MATATSTGSGAWSAAIWSGGSGSGGAPADGDLVVITAGHNVLMDVDLSAWTGLQTVTVQGHSTTPAMLYWKDGTSGYLKIRTGYNLVGTAGTYLGRILANSDGVWGNTGALAYAYKAVILLEGNSAINGAYLEIRLYHAEPSNKYVTTYGTKKTVTADSSTDKFTCNSHGYPNARVVSFKVTTGGSLPEPILPGILYYVVSTATNDFKVSYINGGTPIDLTTNGSGTIEVYDGHQDTGTKVVNVFEDVTADPQWTTTAGHNRISLVNSLGGSVPDSQRDFIAGISASTITLTNNNVDSVQAPDSRIYLLSRNISIRSTGTASNQVLIDLLSRLVALFGDIIGAELVNTSHATTNYGYGISYGAGIHITGIISGMTYGVNGFVGRGYIDGQLISCTNASNGSTCYTGTSHVAGCTNVSYYSGIFEFLTGFSAFGCAYLGNETNFTRIESIELLNCYGITQNCRGVQAKQITIKNVLRGFTYGRGIWVGTLITYPVQSSPYLCVGVCGNFHIGSVISYPTGYSIPIISQNQTSSQYDVSIESFGGVYGAAKSFQQNGDIIKTACDGSGDAPSVDPDGGHGYCIEASNIQSNAALNLIAPLRFFGFYNRQQIWLAADTYTITYKIQTTFSSIASGCLALTAEYISTASPLIVAEEVSNATAIATRSDATDWSQTIAVTFTQAVDGWVRLKLELAAYEANKEVYVWPVPVVS